MANRIITLMGTKKVPLEIASEIVVNGQIVARRLTDSINPEVVKAVSYKVERAYQGDVLFTEEQKQRAKKVVITSMPHEDSPMDPNSHISVSAVDDQGEFSKGHVTIDPAQQHASR